MKIALTYNIKPEDMPADPLLADKFAEFDTQETIDGILSAISTNGHSAVPIEANEYAYEKLRDKNIDFVFNFAEGIYGEDREAQIPAMCEMLQLPYLGQTPFVSALILDKAKTKEFLQFYNLPTSPYIVFRDINATIEYDRYPLIVKPVREGSSRGIMNDSVVFTQEALEKKVKSVIETYRQPALVEEYLPGREFTVALLGNGNHLDVLPIVEVNHAALPDGAARIDSYEAKWVWNDHFENSAICPVEIEEKLKLQLERISMKAFNAIGCRDWARIDIRLGENKRPYVLEINSPCGLLPDPKDCSRFPLAARAAGYDFNQLIGKLIDVAAKRYGLK